MTKPHRSALIVVDMLNDFLARGGYYDEIGKVKAEKNGELSEADIDALARLYRHPPPSCLIRDGYQDLVTSVVTVAEAALDRRMMTVFIRTAYDPASPYRPPPFIGMQERRDYACHPGTWGADFVDPVERLASDDCARIVEKHTYDAFFETELRGLLRFHHIDTLYLAGVETNVCVLCTALSALTNGFASVILEDCVATSMPALHAASLQIIEVAKGRRMRAHEFLRLLQGEDSAETIA